MTTLPSIRARLSRSLVALAIVGALAVSVAVWVAVQHEVDELLDDTLRASATVLAGLLSTHAQALIEGAAPGGAPKSAAGDGEFAWQLVDAGGAVRLRSARAPESPFVAGPTLGFTNVDRWRVLGIAFGPGARVLYVAQTRAERSEARAEVAVAVSTVALIAGALSVLWLHLRLGRELQPLAELSNAVGRYDPLQPGASLGPPRRAEFVPVHAAIDDLGRRLARRVAHEQAFTTQAAHALRTPLAGIDAQLAVALRESPPELGPRLRRVREATGRLQRVVSALLSLFRAGADVTRSPVDLGALLARLPIEGLDVQVAPGTVVDADADLLAAALLNLLDNALRYGARQVSVSADGASLRLLDDGPGVGAPRRLELQAALENQSYEGRMGLGLTLADLVARAHDGRLRVLDTTHGFGVELVLAPTSSSTPARPA